MSLLFALFGIAASEPILVTIYERTKKLIVVALVHGLITAVGVVVPPIMLL